MPHGSDLNARSARAHVIEIVATGYTYPSDRVDNESYFGLGHMGSSAGGVKGVMRR
jgi:hypothetical protein